MKKLLLPFHLAFLFLSGVAAAQPAIQWDRRFGGDFGDVLTSVIQAPDGGYVLGGYSQSDAGGDKTESSFGDDSFWIVKVSPDGTKEWDKTLTPGGVVQLADIMPADDGGYITAGSDGFGAWIVKLDEDGNTEWSKFIRAGTGGQAYGAMRKTSDGGYILGMSSDRPAGVDKSEDAINNSFDYWIIKLSADGTKMWDKTLGGTSNDLLTSLEQTEDGGYVLGGYSTSGTGADKTEGNLGFEDYWIIKLDATGTKVWDKTIGGPRREWLIKIIQTPDQGYLLAGQSGSASPGGFPDQSLIKLSETGQTMWSKLLFGGEGGGISALIATADGNYIAGGYRSSDAGPDKSEDSKGGLDYWLVKVAADGSSLWDKTLGSPDTDWLFSVSQTSDGGYILGGESKGGIGGDRSQNQRGISDYWIVKLAPESPLPVRLANFIARPESAITSLSWQTTSESRSDQFEVEHSTNGKVWRSIGTFDAKGESNALQTYHFTHENPEGGDNYYRLKMADTDGSFTYSGIERVRFARGFEVSVYPNPAAETIHIKAPGWSEVKGLQILDTQGKTLYRSESTPSQDISAKTFKPGLYLIRLTLTDGTETIRKIVIKQ